MKRERTCVICGCTTSQSCPGGCMWIEEHRATPTGVCSNCDVKALAHLLNAILQCHTPLNLVLTEKGIRAGADWKSAIRQSPSRTGRSLRYVR